MALDLDNVDYGTTGWNGLVQSNFEKIKAWIDAFSSSYYDYVFIPIEWAEDGDSAPDAAEVITDTNGKVSVRTFAGDAVEDVRIPWKVPSDINVAAKVSFRVCCIVTNATGPSSEGVSFKLSGYARGDGDSLTGTFGTSVESKKTGMTYAQNVIFDTVLSGDITITDLAADELVMLKLERDTADEDDTYEQVIGVYGIVLKIKRDLAG
jgi:hypothetical protein